MNRLNVAATAAFALFATTLLVGAAGCSAPSEEDLGAAEGAATPAGPNSQYTLAETCQRLFTRHAATYDLDIEKGTIRWGAGDVPGVTDPDLGQEYCEYHGVQNGKIVKKGTDVVPGAPVSCVFTTVFADAPASNTTKLQAAMAAPENLGVAAADKGTVAMQVGFNTRAAATQLLSDCGKALTPTTRQLRERTAACFLAVSKATASGDANLPRLSTLCKGNVNDAATWTEATSLGVKVLAAGEEGYENQADILSCMQVQQAGVPWRNSDPMICSRSNRAEVECGCKVNAVPTSLNGFDLTGWVNDSIPDGCRLAKVDGQPYPYVAICDISAQDVADIPGNPTYARSLQSLCHDKFGVNLVIKLPLKALEVANTCNTSSTFCGEYTGSAVATTEAPAPTTTPTTVNRTTGAPAAPTAPAASAASAN